MTDINGFVNLDFVVSRYIMLRDEDDRYYEKYLQLAIDAITEANMYNLPTVKVAYLTLSDVNTVSLPSDYIDYVLIGIEIGGRIWTLTRNKNIALPVNTECGEWSRDNIATSVNESWEGDLYSSNDGYLLSGHYFGSEYIQTPYAHGGGVNEAYYRIDEGRREIIMLTSRSLSGYNIVLEYKSSGVNGSTVIRRGAVDFITAYIDEKVTEYNDSVSQSEKERKRYARIRAGRKLLSTSHGFTLDEFLDKKYQSMSQVIKR